MPTRDNCPNTHTHNHVHVDVIDRVRGGVYWRYVKFIDGNEVAVFLSMTNRPKIRYQWEGIHFGAYNILGPNTPYNGYDFHILLF